MRLTLTVALCFAAVTRLGSFQTPAPKPGAIHGRVLQAKSGEPVKKAVVILRHAQEPGVGVTTSDSGEFQFDNLTPDAYTISAERTGFILDPASEKTAVNVQPGPAQTEASLKMLRTGAVSGHVLDSDGDPLAEANIQVVSIIQKKGSANAFYATPTNDRGEYRAFNIPPGKYRISASYQSHARQRLVKMLRTEGQPDNTSDEIDAVTWYPSLLDPKLAQIITINDGADLQGLDIRMLRARGVTVRGTVLSAAGAPSGGIVMVSLSPLGQTIGVQGHDQVVQDATGNFELPYILPGTYAVTAAAPLLDGRMTASRVIQVGNADVSGIRLTLGTPQTLRGAIVPPDGRKLPEGLIVLLVSRETRFDAGGAIGQPTADGAFQLRDAAPGDYDIALGNTGPADDLYVSDIRAGDEDALTTGLHVGGQPLGTIKIVLKANGATVQASAKTSEGKPLPDATIKLVPEPPRRTQMAIYADCRTDAGGACSMLGIAPGAYRAFAFTGETKLDFRDPAATKDIDDSGKLITVAESDRKSVELTPQPDDN